MASEQYYREMTVDGKKVKYDDKLLRTFEEKSLRTKSGYIGKAALAALKAAYSDSGKVTPTELTTLQFMQDRWSGFFTSVATEKKFNDMLTDATRQSKLASPARRPAAGGGKVAW